MHPSAGILTQIVAVGCFAFYGTTGCSDRGAPSPITAVPSQNGSVKRGSGGRLAKANLETATTGRKRRIQTETLPVETWFAITIDGNKVGHRRVIRREIERGNRIMVETAGHEHIMLVREGREVIADFDCIARETATGRFLEAEYRLPFGLNQVWTVATVEGTSLHIRPKSGNGPAAAMAWPPDTRGPFAVENSLRAQPMTPGETRTERFFDASLGQVISASLRAADWETTELLGSDCRLLRIEVQTALPNAAELTSTLWIDDQGIVWKESQTVGVTVVTYRSSKQVALAPADGQPLDLFHHVLVPIVPPISLPYDRDKIVYKINVPDSDPSKLFVHDSRQQVQILGPHQILLTVDQAVTNVGVSTGDPRKQISDRQEPGQADRSPSSLVECDHPDIKELASSAAPGNTNAAAIATSLEQLVYQRVEQKSYGTVFASALEAAKSREGDCTEHSVLLVALCRAREIPARAAMGLVYSEAHQAFAYHMWTEVWTGDSWLGLDATLGRGRIGPTYLKMSQSSLGGPAALAEMAMILQAVGELHIRVVPR